MFVLLVVGASRGAELALLLAASFPDLVGPVVAYTPSSVVWFGVGFKDPAGATRSTWTRQGKPLPHLPFPPGVAPAQSERGLSMLPVSEAALDDGDAVERSAIAVEHAHGPLLLVSGGDDRVWATGRMCKMIVDRMSRRAIG
jgi:pimeloyl-ACP methyl ester carboxylesterase